MGASVVPKSTGLRPSPPCTIVIFGAAGDLTKRKLLPALYNLKASGLLPRQLAIVGVTRKEKSHEQFREEQSKDIREFATRAVEETLWEELRAASPAAEVVTEGRIVAAGALADRGLLDEAIKVLERAPANPRRILPHHLRLWYALADLQERAGDLPAARALFRKVSAQDPAFVDVAERLAALS